MTVPEPRAAQAAPAEPPRSRRWLLAAWAAPVLYAAVIFLLSSRSDLPSLPSFRGADKIAHALEYAGFAALLAHALAASGLRVLRAAILAVAIAAAFGASDEVHQYFVPHRDADPKDLVADTLGAVVGAALAAVRLRGRGAQASIRP